jgi:uncharacterized protein YlzI (FlbEa/FlbD family)
LRFLELLKGHRGELVLVNADQVELVFPEPNGTSVCLIGGRTIVVRNTPEEILEMLERVDSTPRANEGVEVQSSPDEGAAETPLGQIRSLGA